MQIVALHSSFALGYFLQYTHTYRYIHISHSHLHSRGTPGVFYTYTYLYNHAHRLRPEKVLHFTTYSDCRAF